MGLIVSAELELVVTVGLDFVTTALGTIELKAEAIESVTTLKALAIDSET